MLDKISQVIIVRTYELFIGELVASAKIFEEPKKVVIFKLIVIK